MRVEDYLAYSFGFVCASNNVRSEIFVSVIQVF